MRHNFDKMFLHFDLCDGTFSENTTFFSPLKWAKQTTATRMRIWEQRVKNGTRNEQKKKKKNEEKNVYGKYGRKVYESTKFTEKTFGLSELYVSEWEMLG